MPYKCAKICLGWHIFMSFIQMLVKLHAQYMEYLLDLLGIVMRDGTAGDDY